MKHFLLAAALSILATAGYSQELASGEAEYALLSKIEFKELIRQETQNEKYTIDSKALAQKHESDNENKTRIGILIQNTLLGALSGVMIGAGSALSTQGADGSSNAKYIVGYSLLGGAIGVPIGFVVGGFRAITHKRIRREQ